MTVAVIGPGALGTLLGALLGRSGAHVWMLDHSAERAAAIAARGLRVEGGSRAWSTRVRATARAAKVPAPDLILICVKTYDTAAAGASAARIRGEAPVLTLQNGLGNVEALGRAVGRRRVLGGTAALGSTLLGPGRVRSAGVHGLVLAEPGGRVTPRLEAAAATFRGADIPVSVSRDLPAALWTKAIVNCAVNPVGALVRLRNGDLLDSPSARRCMRLAAAEGAAVAAAKNIALAHRNMARQVEAVCRATAQNLNSMLQDILLGRRTEVDAINGAVVRSGRAVGVATPVNAALWRLVKALEEGADRRVRADALKR